MDILKAIIPVQDELPTGFSMTGHVGRFSFTLDTKATH